MREVLGCCSECGDNAIKWVIAGNMLCPHHDELKPKKKKFIQLKASKKNTYACSDGTRLSKANIEGNIRVAKSEFVDKKNREGKVFCEDCGSVNDRLTCSHIVSVDACQKEGKVEQAWNVDNLELLCIECHMLWEVKKILNKTREKYIRKHFKHLIEKYHG